MSLTTKDKLLKGFLLLGLNEKQVYELEYCGGNCGSRINKFYKMFPNIELPEYRNKCVCEHDIQENCYVTDHERKHIYVIGNCCIRRYLPNGTKSICELCKACHKNRKSNLCNNCRIKCKYCKITINKDENYCDVCKDLMECKSDPNNAIVIKNCQHCELEYVNTNKPFCKRCNKFYCFYCDIKLRDPVYKYYNSAQLNCCKTCKDALCKKCDYLHSINHFKLCSRCTYNSRFYLKVPFEEKDIVKKMGAKWDCELKTWYIQFKFIEDFILWKPNLLN